MGLTRLRGREVYRLLRRSAALDIIDRSPAQIRVKAEDHRRRAAIVDALAVDRLPFDDSPEDERFRRYDLASGQGF